MNIFVDGSYSPQMRLGVGAYIAIDTRKMIELSELTISQLKNIMEPMIKYFVFNDTKGSTDVEEKSLILALQAVNNTELTVSVYTDCQKAKTTQEYNVIHVKGHTKQINRTGYEKIFDVIDKKVRKRLRQCVKDIDK